jgi:hypothetical protein
MSGYLGRMLQVSAPSERRLHPFAGSIYGERETLTPRANRADLEGPRRDGEDQQLLESEQTVVSDLPSAQVATAHTRDPIVFLEKYQPLQPQQHESRVHVPASRKSSGPVRGDLEATPEYDAERSMQQRPLGMTPRLRASSEAGEVVAGVRGGRDAERERSQAPALRLDDIAADHEDGLARKRSATAAESGQLRQTHAELNPREKKHDFAPRQPLQTARPPRTPRREVERNTHSEAPEVQIHIGRIEVLAVQPPAPAAQAPRRERTTSLADYLSRQNGRGR